MLAVICGGATTTALVYIPPPSHVVTVARAPVLQVQPNRVADDIFPTTDMIAALQPDWLGKPAANKYNPGGAGNSEGCTVAS